jgi:hypothetical protein
MGWKTKKTNRPSICSWLTLTRGIALTVHEAGHAVVARALGADVVIVEIDLTTGNGSSRLQDFSDHVNNLAGCKAEHAFDARSSRRTKMRKLLSELPEADRRAARAESYRLAEAIAERARGQGATTR